MIPAADQFGAIAARLAEIESKPTSIAAAKQTCADCEDSGWVETYSPRPPAFQTCPACGNPEGRPSP